MLQVLFITYLTLKHCAELHKVKNIDFYDFDRNQITKNNLRQQPSILTNCNLAISICYHVQKSHLLRISITTSTPFLLESCNKKVNILYCLNYEPQRADIGPILLSIFLKQA